MNSQGGLFRSQHFQRTRRKRLPDLVWTLMEGYIIKEGYAYADKTLSDRCISKYCMQRYIQDCPGGVGSVTADNLQTIVL